MSTTAPLTFFKEQSASFTNGSHFSVNEKKTVEDPPPYCGPSVVDKPDPLSLHFTAVSTETLTHSPVVSSQPISACSVEAATERASLHQLPSETGNRQARAPVRMLLSLSCNFSRQIKACGLISF